ncbi:SDR family NAD(P)-dependent oxidoreductase [Novosphingobium panipatense]|jgi:NAD(P)-dependent dehydrogenase (short-subunit alcohol dehydrogenase family)|uniref:SDR family NAD(P)-dependent oxidoreductase n=1 Tax=Novosphingobium TaxID=165696 RepID=UPI000CDB402A|nr:SDR family NAD(P)-dependent oxidoreductase [Novosphingobium sp. HII-3]
MNDLRFDNRVAVITGGGRGLGRAHALLLASRGCRIVVNDPGLSMAGDATGEGPAEVLAAEIRALGGEAVANVDTVATQEGGKAIIDAALEAFGRIDILIHSAGNVRRGSLSSLPYDDFTAVLDVHLKGAYHVVREAFPHMMAQRYGRIVLTSSINGLYGKADNVTYSMCKAGFMGLSNTAAIEGQHANVRSNLIVPAAVTRMSDGIDTSKFPPMEPEMVAPMVGYLCHEDCEVTGEMYIAMGGRLARAWVAENSGVYRTDWSLEGVAEQIGAIREAGKPLAFPPVPDGQLDHLLHGFAMIRENA